MSGMSSGHSAESDVFVLRFAIETSTGCFFTPAVAAEDPLALLDEAVMEFEELLADVKKSRWLFDSASGEQRAAGFYQRDELVGNFLGLEGALAVVDPLLEEGLDLGANVLHFAIGKATGSSFTVAGQNVHRKFCSFLHDALHAVAHLATTICSNLSVGQNISLLLC